MPTLDPAPQSSRGRGSADPIIMPWHVLLVLFVAVQAYSIRTFYIYPPAFLNSVPKNLPPLQCESEEVKSVVGSANLINEDAALADDDDQENGSGPKRHLLVEKRKAGVTTAADVAEFLRYRWPACKLEKLGGAPWPICGDELRNRGVVYSFGVGKDLEFEGELAKRNQQVFVFDPFMNDTTFASMLQSVKDIPPRRMPQFRQFALGPVDGVTPFHAISGSDAFSAATDAPADDASSRDAAVLRLRTFMCMYSHRWIDILRLDIHGLELDMCESEAFGTSVGDLTNHGSPALAEKTPVGPTPGSVPIGQLVVRFKEQGVRDAAVRRQTCEQAFERWGLKKVYEDKASNIALFARTDAVASA